MRIGKQVGVSLVALALAGGLALSASGAEGPISPAPAAEAPATPAPAAESSARSAPAAEAPAAKVVKTAARSHRVVKTRVAKRFWRHRPIRVAAAEWWPSAGVRHYGSAHYLVLGVGF